MKRVKKRKLEEIGDAAKNHKQGYYTVSLEFPATSPGSILKWFAQEGQSVSKGVLLAQCDREGAHDLIAPADGT